MSVNKVILIGNVGQDPEIRYVDTRRAYTTASGAQVPERTEWHRIVMWDRHAETAEKYIRKGVKLYIEGKLRTRVWEDRNTIKRNVTEILVENFDILSRPAST